jgi:hypothetical protein
MTSVSVDPDNPVLDADQRRAVIDQAIATLDHYVLPQVATQLQSLLDTQLQGDSYNDIATAPQLAERLTLELQATSGDRQLQVHFSPQPLPDLSPNRTPTAAELAAERDRSAQRNFDVNRVERLRGNVGYLELYGFEPPEFVGEVLAAAFTFLAHSRALILDLRHNRGGSPGTVALLCSYLLPAYPATHLNDLYWRPDDSTRQWWTLPHLSGPRYLDRPVYLLTSTDTFSAAEECAYDLQVLRRAMVVGEHTAGGAHPGQGYRLNDHFWMFVPTGRSINPITGSHWGETGIVPDVKVPKELALLTAHRMALDRLLDTQPDGGQFRELQRSLLLVERELNARRAELITQLKRPSPDATVTED